MVFIIQDILAENQRCGGIIKRPFELPTHLPFSSPSIVETGCGIVEPMVSNGNMIKGPDHTSLNHGTNKTMQQRRTSSSSSEIKETQCNSDLRHSTDCGHGKLHSSRTLDHNGSHVQNGLPPYTNISSLSLGNCGAGITTLRSLKTDGFQLKSRTNLDPGAKVSQNGSYQEPRQTISQNNSSSYKKPSTLVSSDYLSSNVLIAGGKLIAVGTLIAALASVIKSKDWNELMLGFAAVSAITSLIWVLYVHRVWVAAAIRTIPRDLLGLYRYLLILVNVGYCQKRNWTFLHMFARNVKRDPQKICFYFEDEVWTFKDVDEQSNRVANYFLSQGVKKGECVSLFMENRPNYVCIWLGLSKIGAIPALINFNLRLQPLKHCFEVAKPKAIIFGHELGSAIEEVAELGPLPNCALYSSGHGEAQPLFNAMDLDEKLARSSTEAPMAESPVNFTDKLLYIFTSGTTGLPKAAIIKHSRFIFFTMGIHYFVGISNDEVIYDPLPLYHTAGGMLGVGQALIHGCTAVLRRKFSASAYFKDCAKYNCSAAQYIGEICRYLLCQPPSKHDKAHQVKLMFGNGLRPQIWNTFAERFNIRTISEFYGATEGNCNIINIDNHVGSVGFISIILPWIYPVTLIKVDEVTGEVIRDSKTGLVQRCKANEPGELVGKIVPNHPVREFDGYADSNATTKKIVTDVFRKGDAAFRTGDVLIMDQYGYFYFKDRTGDTFRWKGENCSTAEVEAVVSQVCSLKDAVVYGVEIPGADGRAGMAAILDLDGSLNMEALATGINRSLPAYARPLFVRIVKHMDMTGTYKMKKVELQKEGFDVSRIKDALFFLQNGKYVPLDNQLHSDIVNGQIRL